MGPLPLFVALAASASADIVYLKNGNQMEGVVVSESASSLTLDIGYGTTAISKGEVERVERSAKGRGGQAAAEVKRRRYESGQVVPAGAEKLDALYRGVQSARDQALEARAQERDLDDEFETITNELPDLKARYQDLSDEMPRYDAANDPRGYNRAIGEVNNTGVKIQADALRLQEIDRLKKEKQGRINAYLDRTRELEEYVAGPGAALLKQDADYYSFLNGELKAMAGDFRRETVSAEKRGGGVFVDVLLNGKVHARLMVDTGASTTLLYKEVSDRLALGPQARVGTAHTKVADGRIVEADVVRLDAMAVGRSAVRGSVAAVVPVSGMGFDGLLGMTFLGRFITRVDAANGRLTLEDLKAP